MEPLPAEATTAAKSNRQWWRLGIGILLIFGGILLLRLTPVGIWLKPDSLPAIKTQLGIWAPLGYIALYIAATIVGVPATIFTLAAGALFGVIWGTIWTAIGATLGATAAFAIARFVAGDWVKQKFAASDRLTKLSQGIAEAGFWFVFSIRLAPIFPFGAANYLLGLTEISLPAYFCATAIGILPGTFAYCWLGQGGIEAASGGTPWQLIGALAVLALLSTIPLLIKLFKRDS